MAETSKSSCATNLPTLWTKTVKVLENPPTLFSTVSAASGACSPAFCLTAPVAEPNCVCAPSLFAETRQMTSTSVHPCCVATPCTVHSTAPSKLTMKPTPSPLMAHRFRSSTHPTQLRLTTPNTASTTPSSSTTPVSGATKKAWV